MKRLSHFFFAALLVTTVLVPTTSSAASTYTLNLSAYEAEGFIGLFSDEVQTPAGGAKKCLRGFFGGFPLTKMIITKSSKVKVFNESGKVVGLGSLSTVSWKKTGVDFDADGEEYPVGNCIFSGKIKVKKADFYSISIAGVDEPFDVEFSDLVKKKWKLTLTL
jgi:hypothetical protein